MLVTYNNLGAAGQLGNQMFQYAALLGIKYRTGAKIVFKQEVMDRAYIFDFFNIKDAKVTNLNITNEYKEVLFNFDPSVFYSIDSLTDIIGYFQSEKYFQHCKSAVRDAFTFKDEIYHSAKKILCNAHTSEHLVSVHVRRGDYLKNPHIHPPCSVEYFEKAMNHFPDNVTFVCFSDDIEWCKNNLPNRDRLIFCHNSLEIDMCAMSLCNSNIISNSSFSWWAAWLNKNKEKKIIAPQKWFGEGSGYDYSDIYPIQWTVI